MPDPKSSILVDIPLKIAAVAAIALSFFQIWQGITAEISAPVFRPIHLSWVIVLVLLTHPLFKHQQHSLQFKLGRLIDTLFAVAIIWSTWRIAKFDYDDIMFLIEGVGETDKLAGCITIVLLLEATRRTVGMVMVSIAALFLTYAMYGNYLPAAIASSGFPLEDIIRFHIFSTNGVYGAPLAIAAGVVFIFVLFGAFLQVTGAGNFFIDSAFAIAGKYRGGPAKASVISSAALGSISGSAIANTVTTGSLTIPMMKKLGYKPEQAAGIEAAASTGGQIMPPVMGAGAFVMAQFTGIPYSEILIVSIMPAILYFACTLLYVHIMACKLGLKGMDNYEKLKVVMERGWHFLVPLVLITALLMMSYSPVLVGIAGCAAILIASMLRKHSRITLPLFFEGMKQGAILALPISVACATAGIVVGVVGQTGIGLQFTQFLIALSGGYLFTALALIALAAVILGMGLPVTAAYIVLSIMAVPTLLDFGVSLLAAHMIVFWLSQTSNVTPPIALAAFAGAGIAKSSPMQSAVQAFKLAQGFFLIPMMMAFSGLIWVDGEVGSFAFATLATIALIIAFAGSIEGYMFGYLTKAERLLWLAAAACMVLGTPMIEVAAMIVLAVLLAWNMRKAQSLKTSSA
ncbi:TRAP transporter permease [Vibrio maerlii]|uniref:TRAP transporter permease n=1 Tax=Vibrio maerlii TaxID=2231648 RepID=UPI000E3ED631|nr:TRAP transporter fused permease subunit [Vibrio maerlii]